MRESTGDKPIPVGDISYNTLSQLLQYLYTDAIQFGDAGTDVVEMLAIANQYLSVIHLLTAGG